MEKRFIDKVVLITGAAAQNLYCAIASASVVGVLFGKYLYYKNVYKSKYLQYYF